MKKEKKIEIIIVMEHNATVFNPMFAHSVPIGVPKLFHRVPFLTASQKMIETQLIYDLGFRWHFSGDYVLFVTSFISDMSFYMD